MFFRWLFSRYSRQLFYHSSIIKLVITIPLTFCMLIKRTGHSFIFFMNFPMTFQGIWACKFFITVGASKSFRTPCLFDNIIMLLHVIEQHIKMFEMIRACSLKRFLKLIKQYAAYYMPIANKSREF